jgi:LemA protein
MSAQGPADRAGAENMLTGALKSLFALSESYPQLQAAGNFRDLQQTLKDLENGIQQARRYYNAVVRDYNTKIGQVPTNILARAFGFSAREFFEIGEGEGEVPRVSFS